MPETGTERLEVQGGLSGPDVIVDFIFDDGLFFIAVQNIGDKPAYKVSVQFDKRFRGVGGAKDITEMPLFRNIEFLAPWKDIVTFLDTSAAYFGRDEPTRVSARISYQDARGRTHKATITHDLEIYRDIGYVRREHE